MNRFSVVKAVPLPQAASVEAQTHALPKGFPILIDVMSMEVFEPGSLFLQKQLLSRAYPDGFPSSAPSVAQDLRDFLEYLDVDNLDWRQLTDEVVTTYQNHLAGQPSPITHEIYSPRTVNRRISVILAFRKYIYEQGWSKIPPMVKVKTNRYVDPNALPLVHTAASSVVVQGMKDLPRGLNRRIDRIHPMTSARVRAIFAELGPFPKDNGTGTMPTAQTPCRDRLMGALALTTGMRRIEVRCLKRWPIEALISQMKRERLQDNEKVTLELERTKGQKPGKVYIPVWVLKGLEWYIVNERQAAFKRSGRSHEPEELFLNHELQQSQANIGQPVTDDTISRVFREAVLRTGYVIKSWRTNPFTGERREWIEPAHTFHDLRHTFAVWLYYAEEKEGNVTPWKTVQVRLRHSQLATTEGTYLKIVEGKAYDPVSIMRDDFRKIRQQNGF